MNEGDNVVERSPRGVYIRFDKKLGTGAYKTVYKAYDVDQGIDVAWNAIDIGALPHGEKARIIQEVELLKRLEHKNIINFYGSWFAKEKNQVVFITEIMTAGTLKSYIKRVHFVKWRVIKRWCLQILDGLNYLHSQNPPVIHRDLKCDNIFINGNTGDIRIGDLGLSTQMALEKPRAQSVLGTPEFMAPELYDENYDEKVDIYAFGMCVLEMVTKDVPYSECANPAQIYKKVTAGIRPQGLSRIKSQAAKDFIELCLSRGNGQIDVTADYLINHTFLKTSEDDDTMVECIEPHGSTPPMSPAHNSVMGFEHDEKDVLSVIRSDKRRHSSPPVPILPHANHRTSIPIPAPIEVDGLGKDEPRSNSLQFKNRPTTDAPLSAGAVAVNDRAAEAILASMHHIEVNHDERKAIMDGRNTPLAEDKKMNLRELKEPVKPPPTSEPNGLLRQSSGDSRKNSMTDGIPSAPNSAPNIGTQLPPMPPLQKKASIGDPATSFKSIVQPQQPLASNTSTVSNSTPIRTRGRRHEIKATKDTSAEHSILLSLRIILDGKSKEIKFTFNLFTESPHAVACELAADVGILETEVDDIADSIAFLATEGKTVNLPEVDVDVWEESPEPYSFSSKPLPSVSKMNLVPHMNASFDLDQTYSMDDTISAGTSFHSTSSSSSRDQYALSMDDPISSSGPNSLSKQSSFQEDMEWTATNNLSPPHSPMESNPIQMELNKDHGEVHIEQAIRDEKEKHEKEIEKHEQEMEKYRKKIEEIQLRKQQQLDKMQQLSGDSEETKATTNLPMREIDTRNISSPDMRKPRPIMQTVSPVTVVEQ